MGNYFEFRPVIQEEMSFKDFFLFLALATILFGGAILVECIMGNTQVNLNQWLRR